MSYELSIVLGYYAGGLEVKFEGDRPDDFDFTNATVEVKSELFELANINEWRSYFETTKSHARPGQTVEFEVGTLIVENEERQVELTIDSVHELDEQL